MKESINDLISRITNQSQDVLFEQVMTVIDENYDFSPTAFTNGAQKNDVGENSGSCKVFSFALLQQLNQEQTLSLFGQHYRDVKASPDKQDHQNIRQFMLHGFGKLAFQGQALSVKN